MPVTDEHNALFAQLAEKVRGQDGSATVFVIAAMAQEEEEAIVARFQADRAREYDEFAERSLGFLAEIEKETRLQKFTFAELEENEDDFSKLSAWLAKIKARDFFPRPRLQESNQTLETCGTALSVFAEAVYTQEGVASPEEAQSSPPASSTSGSSPKKPRGPRHG